MLPSVRVDRPDQPYLHDLIACVAAPAVWMSADTGQTGPEPAAGLYVSDRRALARCTVRVDDSEPVPLTGELSGGSGARFVGAVRGLGRPNPDPTVLLVRTRTAHADGGAEVVELVNHDPDPIEAEVTVVVAADLATVSAVKAGTPERWLRPSSDGSADCTEVCWRADDGVRSELTVDPAPERVDTEETSAVLRWRLRLAPGETWRATARVRLFRGGLDAATGGFAVVGASGPPWADRALRIAADDRRFDALLRRSVQDLSGLLLSDPDAPADSYTGAGAPWYLTLFGRDSLWAARMALPLGTELAAGTLRTLARRQGTRTDAETEEAPGKILHEVRSPDAAVFLPPLYYGTVDATPLFVSLVAEAWRWGMAEADVAELLPAVERALTWLGGHEGFVSYTGDRRGLANQGWKDSADSIQHADGSLAAPPIALCEVQGYAHAAAVDGAELLRAYGRPDWQRWQDWAAGLRERFAREYWVTDDRGAFPAVALDADGRPVASLTSNAGHLLGTGLLTESQSAEVASRLLDPELFTGWGIRTLAASAPGYNPISYHLGSVWPHDTAIALLGMVAAGHTREAAAVVAGLVDAADGFAYRLPELFAGEPAYVNGSRGGSSRPQPGTSGAPVPYPVSCRPQAWAAAVGPALVTALLGLRPHLPAGRVELRPLAPSPVGSVEITGVRLGAGTLDVRLAADGSVEVLDAPAGVDVTMA